ncbi:MAG TPA: hypothetical protein VJ553_00140 [Candidatus Paceibacterota bacterium]|nr:hypothetical protein [Candidatus Paceibacterota bacterium]
MKREQKVRNAEDYELIVSKEMEYYGPLARDLNISEDVIVQAARLGVRDGIHTHRHSPTCKYREEECVTWNIRHMADVTLVRAALLASTEEDMEKAEEVLMRLIED